MEVHLAQASKGRRGRRRTARSSMRQAENHQCSAQVGNRAKGCLIDCVAGACGVGDGSPRRWISWLTSDSGQGLFRIVFVSNYLFGYLQDPSTQLGLLFARLYQYVSMM
ncbi:unnamed protein product [Calypogeia fissa]